MSIAQYEPGRPDTDTPYDSSKDTQYHQEEIIRIINILINPELYLRAYSHDMSKYKSPEKECYDKYIPLLRQAKYGSDEYNKIREKMKKDGLDHHTSVNRHHPEHFKNGVSGMNIVDLVEMICDWFAASLRSDTSFVDGLDANIKRFNIPPMLKDIIINTYNDYFKDYESATKRLDDVKDTKYINKLKLDVYERHHKGRISDSERDRSIAQIGMIGVKK